MSVSQKAPVVPFVPSSPTPIAVQPCPFSSPLPQRTSQLAPATLSPFYSTLVLGSEAEMTSWWAAALPMASPNPVVIGECTNVHPGVQHRMPHSLQGSEVCPADP